MGNIIGEEIEEYVAGQINARQAMHGSGVVNQRTPAQINVLNSQTSWVKLASAVSVNNARLTEIGVSTSYHGMELAKEWVLFAGTSRVEGNRTTQREGFQPQNKNSSYTYGEFGYVPMPGIISTSIKSLNRGSLKKASVKLKVHDREQFEIIDLLYLRLGYTVLLEWGNSIYTPNGIDKEIVRNTLIDDKDGFFNAGFANGKSYLDILPRIEQYRAKWNGNYDGILGKVSNFDWSFNEDGSYDINLTIISLGDVVESLKTNISVDKNSQSFLEEWEKTKPPPADPPEEDPITDNREANALTFMLWAWKWTNNFLTPNNKMININTPDTFFHTAGQFMETSATLSTTTATYEFTTIVEHQVYRITGVEPRSGEVQGHYVTISTEEHKTDRTFTQVELFNPFVLTLTDLEISAGYEKKTPASGDPKTLVNTTHKIKKSLTTTTVSNPIIDFGPKDAFVLLTKNKHYYIRFGALLEYLESNIIPLINSSPKQTPLFQIDKDSYLNWMYSVPNQVSLDPRVCLVRNSNFLGVGGKLEIYHQLLPFRAEDYVTVDPNLNKAYIMNIYLNFNFILDSLSSNTDEKGDVNVYNFIAAICDGLNKALGGVNNLEPIIDENENKLKIVDTTPIPGITKNDSSSYTLQLYGYDNAFKNGVKTSSKSNFIRKIDLKTAITPEYATMITVGATAGGYIKGTEATAFSRWNLGLTDRFKEEIIPSNPNSQKATPTDVDEAETNYVQKFLKNYTGKHGFNGNMYSGGNNALTSLDISSDAIDRNLSVVTEYYKFLQSQNKEGGGGTVGFIPFKLGLTMDGLSGIKIYNKLHVNTRFLPSNYGKTLDLIVTGVSHDLSNHDWETQIEATVIPKTTQSKTTAITIEDIQETIQVVAASIPLTGAEKISNIKRIATYLKSIGFTREGTIGLIGNILGESQANPRAAERDRAVGGLGGIGIVQWTASRRRKLEKEAGNDNGRILDLNFQLRFLGKELQNSYKSTFNKLTVTNSISDAVIYVLERFEVPGTYLARKTNPKAYEATKAKRIGYANSVISIVDEIYK